MSIISYYIEGFVIYLSLWQSSSYWSIIYLPIYLSIIYHLSIYYIYLPFLYHLCLTMDRSNTLFPGHPRPLWRLRFLAHEILEANHGVLKFRSGWGFNNTFLVTYNFMILKDLQREAKCASRTAVSTATQHSSAFTSAQSPWPQSALTSMVTFPWLQSEGWFSSIYSFHKYIWNQLLRS